MTEEEKLLAEAKQRYPIGTKFKSPQSGSTFTIDDGKYWGAGGGDIRCDTNNKRYSPFLKYNDKWAEVISRPEPVVINTYEIY